MRVREPVRGSENSAQAFPVFPWPVALEGREEGGQRQRGEGRGMWRWRWGYNRQVTVRNSCGERLRLSLGVGQTSRQERGG